MIRIAAALLTFAAISIAQQALAASACRPTRDGKDRIENPGACPSGYFARGACCESFRAITPSTQPGVALKTCPTGTVLNLGACVAAK